MKIIAGLGNPGSKYTRNRHNIGFLAVDFIADNLGISVTDKKFSAATGIGRVETTDIFFVKPQTFMNNSGEAVKKILDYYKETSESLLVIHDEIELPFGDVRFKSGGGHKGQNGLRSIIALAGSADFHRIRFGVGRSDRSPGDVAGHVLSDFSADEFAVLGEGLQKALELCMNFINGSI
jgi:PTH1 family peptidyl-tRNA hydrolase